MKVLLFADFRSPHAQGWLRGVRQTGIDVLAVSSENVAEQGPVVSAGGHLDRLRERGVEAKVREQNGPLRAGLRYLASQQWAHTTFEISRRRSRAKLLQAQVAHFEPDLVHALRLPYEGVSALSARLPVPVVVSSWGLDFVPQAQGDRFFATWLRRVLPWAAGFVADAPADLERARDHGLRAQAPQLLAAGNFGLTPDMFVNRLQRLPNLVVCGRRPGLNIDIDGFLRMMEELRGQGDLRFAMVGAESLPADAKRRVAPLIESGKLVVHDTLTRTEFVDLLCRAAVVVSPARWDGTPNTVLEALATGAQVVAGRLDQLVPLERGLPLSLVDLRSPREMAEAVLRARMAETPPGRDLPDQFPEWLLYDRNLARVADFYEDVVRRGYGG